MTHVLGVDGGNTKTVALVATDAGRIVGYGRGDCGDISAGPSEEYALTEITRAVDQALAMAGASRDELDVSYYCLAGADWPEDYAYLKEHLGRAGGQGRVLVGNDALGALRAGSSDGTGVVITCGTGIAAAARNPDGDFWHSGYWAEPLCGVELGRQALRAVFRAELGIDPPTLLTSAVLTAFGKADVTELLHGIEGRHAVKPTTRQLAGLAPMLLDGAAAGDATSVRIVTTHGATLGDYAEVAARKVGIDATTCTLVLNGGVFRHSSELLKSAVLERLGRVDAVSRSHEPAVGALLLALEAGGSAVDRAVMGAVESSLPPAGLYSS